MALKEHWGLLDTSLYAAQIGRWCRYVVFEFERTLDLGASQSGAYLCLAAALGLAALLAVLDFLWH